jgi:hypothetical protein
MATELTWTSDVNRAVASASTAAIQSQWELWYLCASLVGNTGLGFASNAGNWSVVRTCGSTDGTAGNLTADTTDRLHLGGSGAFTTNDWVFGANTTSGTGRSWALLQSPSALGSYYLIVDFGNATGGRCDLVIGKTLSTNGTTTARPTLTDEWVYSGAQYSSNTITATHRCSLMLSSRGDFWFYETFTAAATMYSAFGVTKLQNVHSADGYQVVSLFAGGNGVNGASGFQMNVTGSTSLCGSTNTTIKGRNYSGSSLPTWVCIAPSYSNGGTGTSVINVTTATAQNVSDATYNGFPAWVLDFSATELKGRLADVLIASGGAAQASTFPGAAPFDYAKFGHLMLPWSSSSAPTV